MSETSYYIGIDLGTTNSVIAWGRENSRTKLVDPQVVQVQMRAVDNSLVRKGTLPSCVYMKDPYQPIVGEYARGMIGRSPHVVRSSKSFMGSAHTYGFDGQAFTPSDIAALILRHLASEAQRQLGFRPQDVVITVPASFDSDMRRATLEAAEQSDFNVRHPDGRPRLMLLDEPRAALYDFVNRQQQGQVPDSLIDFSMPKVVLVFDLGGGTLDVSLHRVSVSPADQDVRIEDYAVSRYTRIGGDNFDDLLARRFMEAFRAKVNLAGLDEIERRLLESSFLNYAESAKIELTSEIERGLCFGTTSPQEVEILVSRGQVYDGKAFEYNLSSEEYERIVAPLLAEHLDLDSLNQFELLRETDNIIYPILDVLNKAKLKLGSEVRVEAVLLNGGMTKLHAVQARLKRLFGFDPLSAGDPDFAVARGAVVYHHLLSQGKQVTKILNSSIGIGLQGGLVRHVARAGHVLPYESPVFTEFSVPITGATHIDLPFYVGESQDTQPPNRRIASRSFKFPQPLREGDGISMQVRVDESNLMDLEAWLTDRPDVRFKVAVSADRTEEPTARAVVAAPRSVPIVAPKAPPRATGDFLDVTEVMETHRADLGRCGHGQFAQNSNLRNRILTREKEILNAQNGKDFLKPLLKLLGQASALEARGRLLILLGNLNERYRGFATQAFIDRVSALISPDSFEHLNAYERGQYLNEVVRYGIEALGKTLDPQLEPLFLELLASQDTVNVRQSLLFSLGKVGATERVLKALDRHMRSQKQGDRIAAFWALGKVGTRERDKPIALVHLRPAFEYLIQWLPQERHEDAKRNGVYALAEIGDARSGESGLPPELRQQAINLLRSMLGKSTPWNGNPDTLRGMDPVPRMVNIGLHMMEGVHLSSAEEEVLLTIRTQLS